MYHIPNYNLSRSTSTLQDLVHEYKQRIEEQIAYTDFESQKPTFLSFAENKLNIDTYWVKDNEDRFLKDTPNEIYKKREYLSQLGFILCVEYSPDGQYLVVGHSTGLIQVRGIYIV